MIDNLQNFSAHDRIDARHSQAGVEGYGQRRTSSKGPIFGAYNHETDETHKASHLHPLDAAIPPVVRPSKRAIPSPSLSPNAFGGFANVNLRPSSSGSQWTRREDNDRSGRDEYSTFEPKHRKSDQSLSKLGKDQKGKRASLTSRASNEHVTKRPPSYLSSLSNSSTFRTSESIRQGRKRSSDVGDRSSMSFLDDSSPDRKPIILNIPSRRSSRRISGEKISSSIAEKPSMSSVGGGNKIPSRASSLRHSIGAAPSPRTKRTSRYSEKEIPLEQEDVVPELESQSKFLTQEISTESDTVRRIEELKARRASWNQNNQVHKPPSEMQTFMEEPSAPLMPVKESLIRTVSTPVVTIISREIDSKDDLRTPARRRSQLLRKSFTLLRTQSDTVVPTSTSTIAPTMKSDRSNNKNLASKSKRTSRSAAPISPNGVDLSHLGIDERDKVDDRPPTADSIDMEVDKFLASPRLSQRISDPYTGRVITFSEVGDPEGSAVICCVGMGLTRYLTAFYDDLARTLRLRLITPDRPGVGESDAYVDGSDTPLGWPGENKPAQHLFSKH